MKNYVKQFFCAIVIITVLSTGVKAAVRQKMETVTIQTSAICESCKKRIERELKATAGIEEAILNLNNKKVKVKFESSKISVEQIRTVISNTGYDADDVKKNEEAFNKLPHCCQKAE